MSIQMANISAIPPVNSTGNQANVSTNSNLWIYCLNLTFRLIWHGKTSFCFIFGQRERKGVGTLTYMLIDVVDVFADIVK